jgi:tRNA A-37 threonylcarbamoyl transferase component Bud32
MLDLAEAVRDQCPDVDPAILERHFQSLPATYFERYSATDIARHVRLVAQQEGQRVAVEVRSLTTQTFEVSIAGLDYPGALACITAALAVHGFGLEDVQVSTYLGPEGEAAENAGPRRSITVLRMSGKLRGQSAASLATFLQDRLAQAFEHLAKNDLVGAQTLAADSSVRPLDEGQFTPPPVFDSDLRLNNATQEGLVVGNDFHLERRLARGGTSEIYLANQASLDRKVVVKLFRHTDEDEEQLTRFNREAVVLAQFSCPQIVQVLAAGSARDRTGQPLSWMAMEYLAGGDLAQWLKRRGVPSAELGIRWLREALEGLQYAHRRSVLHRDLKPHNLLLTEEGRLKVSDFGLLKRTSPEATGLTPRSTILGTPYYMSPEQALGEPLDERSDLFSLGTTFFHLFSGRLPFDSGSATAVLIQLSQEDAPRLDQVAPQVPVPLAIIIKRMMARRREERYQETGVILEDLASYERRGLLEVPGSGDWVAAATPGAATGSVRTQAYEKSAAS